MKKKVILALPNFRWREALDSILWHYIPYGLCMLAAVIEDQYEVKIIDAYKDDLTQEEFAQRIADEKPDVVGLTVLMDYFGKTLHQAATLVKQVDEKIPVIVGGVYATTNIEKVMADEHIDYLIAGEGEQTFPLLLDKIFASEFPQEEGIYWKKDGVIVGTGRSHLITNLDQLPLPAYHLIDYPSYICDVSRNSVDRPPMLPYAEIFTSRGCPYHCCFCQVKHIIGQNFRARSAKNVLAEVDWLVEQYGIKSLVILDDNFFVNRDRAIKLMRGFAERHLEWKMIATAVFLLDDELLEIMRDTGCRYIDCAIESGTERVLHEVIHKPIKSFEQVKYVVRKAQSLGIYVCVNFIVGFPSETWDEIRETLRFAEELSADYTKVFNAVPLPHTELYQECVEKKCLVKDYDPENIDWKMGYIETNEFSREDLLILRAYEWDRLNFTDAGKRKKTMEIMEISESELAQIRKDTRVNAAKLLRSTNLL